MDQVLIQQLANELLVAEDTATPILPLTDRYPNITIQDAYAIQKAVIDLKLARGEVVIGKKIGLTSKGIRDQVGVHEPDYGVMTDAGWVKDGECIDAGKMICPRIEAEIVFVLKKDLDKKVVTAWDVIDATAGVMPALEIVDSRIKDWRIKIQDTVSDAASYARVVTGGNRLVPINDLDLSMIPMASFRNGELMYTGCGAAVMASNPVNSVVWLANKMNSFGTPLRAGEIILSGAFTPVFDFRPGDHVFVRFGPLGNVSLSAQAK